MTKKRDYWQKRFEMLEEERYKNSSKLVEELTEQYRVAQNNIQKEINNWYKRFADNNQITLAEARKMLNKRELAELKWDVNEYIKRGQENAIDQRWAKELENASARVHISRLDALKLQMRQQVETVKAKQLTSVNDLLSSTYKNSYYKTAYEIQKGINVGWTFDRLDDNRIAKALAKPWTTDGRTFSNRIWSNQEQLINSLNTNLTQAIIRGDNPSKIVDKVAKLIGDGDSGASYSAKRLVHTESAFFAQSAQAEAYKELGVERYEFLATLDKRTSAPCQSLDGEVFNISELEEGVNSPPLHPNCRSTTVPYFEDMAGVGERAARNEDGRTYYVPSNMKYKDWEQTIVNVPTTQSEFAPNTATGRLRTAITVGGDVDIKEVAVTMVSGEKLPINVKMADIKNNGQCEFDFEKGKADLKGYTLRSTDDRSSDYRIKTICHELYHAKSNGLNHDIMDIGMSSWIYTEEVFAESTAHYMIKSAGITTEITPAYAEYLVSALPRLKKLPEFATCQTIADFGEVAYKFRFGNNPTAIWSDVWNKINRQPFDLSEYTKHYREYILDNREGLVDKMLESMPSFERYKPNMINDVTNALDKLRPGVKLSGNEDMVFSNVLIITMNRLGVV